METKKQITYTSGDWRATAFAVTVNDRPIFEAVIGGHGKMLSYISMEELQKDIEMASASPALYKAAKALRALVDNLMEHGLQWDKKKIQEWTFEASFASNDVLYAMNKAEGK